MFYNGNYIEINRVPNLISWLYYFIMFTISFDIFLNITLGGFSLRVSQVLLIFIIIYALFLIIYRRRVNVPLGMFSLIYWALFVVVFTPNTTYFIGSLLYSLWFLVFILMIFSTVQIFHEIDQVLFLVKVYILSFLFVSSFGLIQFLIGLIGIEPPLVVQYLGIGKIPRINAFSYEPSYFSTYMIIGWVLVFYLKERNCKLIDKKILNITFYTSMFSLVLSSSRMGWIIMILWFLRYPVLILFHLVKGNIRINHVKYISVIFVCAILVIFIINFTVGFSYFSFLLQGLGIKGYSDHSSEPRINSLIDTINVFLESPIIGYSFGGISSAIAKLHGVILTNASQMKIYQGMSVFVEVLAASGIFGFVFFCIYMFNLIVKPLRLAKMMGNHEYSKLLKGMVLSLIFVCIILQFNQNILRGYFWLHVSILSSLYFACLKSFRENKKLGESVCINEK